MDYQSRKDLVDRLQELELRYDVHSWELEGVHIWPIIKKTIFFYHFQMSKGVEKKNRSKKSSITNKLQNQFKRIRAFFYVKFKSIGKYDFVFSGAPSHRINLRGQFINRYFDPIMDELQSSMILAEYKRLPSRNIYKQDRVIDLTLLLPAFAKKRNFNKSWSFLNQNKDFIRFLGEVENMELINTIVLKRRILVNINNVFNWTALFRWFLERSQAKAAFGLCYYSAQMYGMNLAARKLNIPCGDMQHGTQGHLHIAYNIQKHPANGYNLLPTHFWVWDEQSKKDLQKNYQKYNILKGGNPSLSYFADKQLNFKYDQKKPTILITVQPLAEILPDYIYQSINETASHYNWWIRLHPRMNQKEVNSLKRKLNDFDIKEFVKIEEVSDLPLPQVLANTDLHISKFSGTIAEAALMNVKTIIIDHLGVDSFQDLINQNIAYSLTEYRKEELILKLSELTLKRAEIFTFQKSNYKKYVNEIIK